MNKLLYILLLSQFVFWMSSCDQDIDFAYEGKDRIQFRHYKTDYNGNRHYSDTLTFTYGLMPDSITVDTAKIVVEYLGGGSDQERTYYVSVVEDSTTAVVGTHYEAIAREQKFRPNKLTDTLRIVVYRTNLSDDYTDPETIRLDLKLEPSPDFDLGLNGGLVKKIKMNNYMSEPAWWKGNFGTSLGFFHPEKWKILISFNEEFADQNDCPFNQNNEGREYINGLRKYLEDIPVYDKATGKRIYMYELVDE